MKPAAFQVKQLTAAYHGNKALLSCKGKAKTCLESIQTNGKAMFIEPSGERNKRVGKIGQKKKLICYIFSY